MLPVGEPCLPGSREAAWRFTSEDPADGSSGFWFVKDRGGSGGKEPMPVCCDMTRTELMRVSRTVPRARRQCRPS